MRKISFILFVFISTALFLKAEVQHYRINPGSSKIQFTVRHHTQKTSGEFEDFKGDIYFDPQDISSSKVFITVYANSINTGHDRRDNQLRGKDFFSASSHPTFNFESALWKKMGYGSYEVMGYLTMLGVRLPLTIQLKQKRSPSRPGNVILWSGTGKLDRTEWGMTYASPSIRNEVQFTFEIEAERE